MSVPINFRGAYSSHDGRCATSTLQGDEWGTYVALARSAPPERGMAYRARAPRSRSPRSSLGWGKPTTWRRGTGRRHGKGGRVRDAQEPEPQYMSSTGELIDIERVTISSEGGRWKSTRRGNSLAAYPTSRPVLRRGGGSNLASLSRRWEKRPAGPRSQPTRLQSSKRTFSW